MAMIAERNEAVTGSTDRARSVRWALAGLSLSVLLSSLGAGVANVALPTLAQAFDASFQAVQWIVLAYLLAVTTLVVSVGRLGDVTGRRRLLLAGIVCSRWLGLKRCSTHPLAADRRPGGAGPRSGRHGDPHHGLRRRDRPEGEDRQRHGAARNHVRGRHRPRPVARRPPDRRTRLAGDLPRQRTAGHPGLSSRASPLARRSPEAEADRVGFDIAGTLLLALTLAAYALAVTTGRGGFGPLNMALLSAAAFGVGLFVLAESRAASPLIRLAMFGDPVLSASLATSALVSTVLMATLVVGPFYLSRALGLDAALVGLVMSVGPLVAALTGVPAGRVADRFGAQRVTIVGLTGIAAGSFMLSVTPATLGITGYIAPIVVVTAGYALFQTANNTAVMADVRPDRRGVVSGLLNLSRNLGLVTGASAMGAVFALASGTVDVTTARPEAVAAGTRITFASRVF
jgi:MFS family permease